MSTWDKKGIYHSQWRSASPITVMFTKGVLPSTFPVKEGAPPNPPFAPFMLQGDDTPYTYTIENDACAEAIKNIPTGIWVQVVALGGKDDATLEITLPDGYEAAEGTPGVQAHVPASQPGASTVYTPPVRPESVAEAYAAALRAARTVRTEYEDEFGEELDEATRTMAVTILINSERSNWTMPMIVIPPPDPDDPAEADMVDRITELLTLKAIPESVADQITALVENGLTIGKAQKTITYLEAQPAATEQGALPWDAD